MKSLHHVTPVWKLKSAQGTGSWIARVVRVIPPCGAKRQPHVLKFVHMGTEGH